MEFRQLIYMASVVEKGSFTAAAAAQGITEPGLHKQIRGLERELGVQLFERIGRSIQLTSAGHLLVERITDVINGVQSIEHLAYDLRTGGKGVVTIGCQPVHVVHFLAPIISRFEQENPGMKVRLGKHIDEQTIRDNHDVYDELFKNHIDLVLGPLHPEGISKVFAYKQRAIAVVYDEHPWRYLETITVDQLNDERLISLPRDLWFRSRLEEACSSAGFLPVIELETTVGSLVSLCRSAYAVGVMTEDNLWGRFEMPYPVIVDSDGNELSANIWLQWKSERVLDPAVLAFIEFVKNTTETK